MKSTRIIIKDDEQFEQLDAVRERHGVNWRGMLIKGAERLEAGGVLPTEAELCDGEEDE
ncbi:MULTISPECIES: hypothetical protein [unclassified Haloarcula]|uniref:hypothetical protein n=1 Tax=unclassified Haloarcula TaxID=2624677 RepID=UPI000A4E10A3|nr:MULTISPECIES: hypothetical protein [unclassified Haloarcula]